MLKKTVLTHLRIPQHLSTWPLLTLKPQRVTLQEEVRNAGASREVGVGSSADSRGPEAGTIEVFFL